MNRNSNKSSIVTTVVVLLVCLVLVTGSTFSLFTSKTGTNIAVTTGNVEMVATIDASTLALYSKGAAQTDKFANGGTAAFNDAKTELTLTNITPGDSVEFDIVLENKSTVDLQYRVNWIVTGDLAEALTATVGGADITSGTSEWTLWKADAAEMSQTLSISIELPLDADDNWESLEANIAFNVEAVQANATGEYSPVAFVSSAAGLQAAIDAGCTEIILNDSVTLTDTLVIPAVPATYSLRNTVAPVVIDLNGNTLSTVDKNVVRNDGSPLVIKNGTISRSGTAGGYAINNVSGALSIEELTVVGGVYTSGAELTVTNCNVSQYLSGRHGIYAYNCEAVINSGKFHNDNAGNSTIMAAGSSVVTINGGEFSIANGQAILGWTSCLLDSTGTAAIVINDGIFNGGFRTQGGTSMTINGGSFNDVHGSNYNVYTGATVTVYGGIFTDANSINYAKKYVAEGSLGVANADGTYTVHANTSEAVITLADGAVLDLGGVEFAGKVVVEGNVTIKGDTKIKTLSATEDATITIEDGKTLTLNNFSFGTKNNASAKYVITGGTVTANYGFFQHGVYDLYSNFETGYMYYSYGSDITVYGTFHSQGKGDGLDYIRGKLTIAEGGKSIHDKSLWVGQPASWGAMSASLTVEKGGYVQANSLSVYEGSVAYNDVANVGVEGVGVKYNTLSGKISAIASDVTGLVAAINAGGEVTLVSGNYVMPDGSDLNLQGKTLTIVGDENTVIDVSGIDERDQFVTGATLVFEGVTLNFGTANYMGFANATSLVYRDCTINGLQFLYGPSVTFENCVLNSNGAEHCVWTWGVQNVSFTGCDFTYGDRAVNCYGEGVTTNASFTNCTFTKVDGKDTTGAIETNSSTLTALNLTIENCTVNEGDLWWVSVWDGKNGANTNATVK